MGTCGTGHTHRRGRIVVTLLAALLIGASVLAAVQVASSVSTRLTADLAVPDPVVDNDTLELTFAGDLMAHTVNYRMADYNVIYDAVSEYLHADDLSFVNLEFVIDAERPYSSYPRFNVQPPYVQAAIRAGFDVFSAANNHTADWHREGISATYRFLEEAVENHGIAYSGIRPAAGREFEITELAVGDWSIGFIALTQFSNEWREYAGIDRLYLLTHFWPQRTNEFIAWLSERTGDYDLFVLSYHGGVEYALDADPRKLAFFRRLLDAGVDIVWAHHPHVLQPWEGVTRADGSQALILPSTGNFVSGQPWRLSPAQWNVDRAATGDSALYHVSVDRADGRIYLSLRVTPMVHRRGADGVILHPVPAPSTTEDGWAVYEGQRRRMSRPQRVAVGPEWLVD